MVVDSLIVRKSCVCPLSYTPLAGELAAEVRRSRRYDVTDVADAPPYRYLQAPAPLFAPHFATAACVSSIVVSGSRVAFIMPRHAHGHVLLHACLSALLILREMSRQCVAKWSRSEREFHGRRHVREREESKWPRSRFDNVTGHGDRDDRLTWGLPRHLCLPFAFSSRSIVASAACILTSN